MTHPYASHRHMEQAHKRASDQLSEYARGGDVAQDERMIRKAIGEHDKQLHGGKHTKLKFADGGHVNCDGEKSPRRLDRGGRSGKGKKHPQVSIVIAGGGGQDRPPAVPVPVPVPAGGPPPGGPPPMAMPPRPPMPPPGMPPAGPGMPMRADGGRVGLKSGGRAKRQVGGTLQAARAVPPVRPAIAPAAAGLARPIVAPGMVRARGGGVNDAAEAHAQEEPKMPEIHSGARSALGRLARAKAEGGFKRAVAAGD